MRVHIYLYLTDRNQGYSLSLTHGPIYCLLARYNLIGKPSIPTPVQQYFFIWWKDNPVYWRVILQRHAFDPLLDLKDIFFYPDRLLLISFSLLCVLWNVKLGICMQYKRGVRPRVVWPVYNLLNKPGLAKCQVHQISMIDTGPYRKSANLWQRLEGF